jgi:hypothetical protein
MLVIYGDAHSDIPANPIHLHPRLVVDPIDLHAIDQGEVDRLEPTSLRVVPGLESTQSAARFTGSQFDRSGHRPGLAGSRPRRRLDRAGDRLFGP